MRDALYAAEALKALKARTEEVRKQLPTMADTAHVFANQELQPIRVRGFAFAQSFGKVQLLFERKLFEFAIYQKMHDGLADHLAFLIVQDVCKRDVGLEYMRCAGRDDDVFGADLVRQEIRASEGLDKPVFTGGQIGRQIDVSRDAGLDAVKLPGELCGGGLSHARWVSERYL